MSLGHGKLSLRFALKEKFFSALNIVGLALGIATSIILMLMVQNDLTYDRHYADHEKIYRLGAHYGIPGTEMNTGATARELGPILKDAYPEIKELVRIQILDTRLVKTTGERAIAFYEERIGQADNTYFKIFRHNFLAGDENTCLDDPSAVVITEATARRYFSENDALNETIYIDKEPRKVTAIIRDFPENTHLKFDLLLSGLPEIRPTWDQTYLNGKPISLVFWNPDVYTYMLLPQDYDVTRFYSRFQSIYNTYFKETSDESGGESFNIPVLLPLSEIHFSNYDDWGGNITYLLAFSGIGLLIVMLACINYMNLATAKAVNRATDISLRRIVGANKQSLVFSLLAESLLLSLFSLVVAIPIVYIVLDLTTFNTLIGSNLRTDFMNNPAAITGSVVLSILIGIISGLYPAFFLTSISPAVALKGSYKHSNASIALRKTLTTLQFAIAIFVVSCALFMRNQINFVRTSDLGFNLNNLLVIPIRDSESFYQLTRIKNQLLEDPHIVSVTTAASLPGLGIGGNVMFGEGDDGGMQQKGGILGNFVGDDYLKTMGIPLLKGRDFRPGDGVDEDGVYIANEAAVKLMGWGNDALGKKVSFWEGMNAGEVVGVVRDFNASSLHVPLEPMFIVKGHFETGYAQIRLTGNQLHETVEYVKSTWSSLVPDHPFEYFFLDERFNEQYGDDDRNNKLLTALAALCIVISLLGVIGLSAFTASQRTKEIGIRKVLGASAAGITYLVSSNMLKLLILAALVVFPITLLVVTRWLENFAYKAPISHLLYAAITVAGLTVVMLTIALQSMKAVRTNPATSLRSE